MKTKTTLAVAVAGISTRMGNPPARRYSKRALRATRRPRVILSSRVTHLNSR
jgi:hypothetical protein